MTIRQFHLSAIAAAAGAGGLPSSTYMTISDTTGSPTITEYTDVDGNWRSYTWDSDGSFTVSAGGDVEYELVAGGGGGGGGAIYSYAGGAGAGGVLQGATNLTPGVYSVSIGSGGVGGSTSGRSTSGGASTAIGLTAIGGGGGGAGVLGGPEGLGGGSGGGGKGEPSDGGTGTVGQGYDGGNGAGSAGGGGGGAGGASADASSNNGGNGGPGITSQITGSDIAGGGAGSGQSTSGTATHGGGAAAPAGSDASGASGGNGSSPGSGGGAGGGTGAGGNGANGRFSLRINLSGGGAAMPFSAEVGIGIANLSYFDRSFAMVDVVRQAQFKGHDWSDDVGADAQGAPTRNFHFQFNAWGHFFAAGTYKLKFKGQADLGHVNISNKVYDAATNTTTADVVLDSVETDNAWISFSNTKRTPESTPGDGVTDIHFYRPGYATDGSAILTTEFITAMQKFNVIRTMDAMAANGNATSAWSERTRMDYMGDTGTKGQAWELQILLANAANRDLWINVPVKADDAYIDKLAKLFKYGSDGSEPYTSVQASPVYPPLNPGLKVYVEYGNEIWNTSAGFLGFGWALEYANANRLDTGHPIAYDGAVTDQYTALRRWVAYRSAFISLAFRAVFGDAAMMTRVRPIFAAQFGNANNFLREGLQWAEGYHGNVRDLWYGGGGAAYYESDSEPVDTNPATMTAYFAGLPSATFATSIATDTIWTKGFGLKNIAYEGGPGPGGSALGGMSGPDATNYAYNNDPRMKDRMQVAHNTWLANGGDMLVYYVYTGSSPWSFTNGVSGATVSDTTSVKMQAIDAIKADTSPPVLTLGTLVPATVYLRDPSAKAVSTEGGTSAWGYDGTAWQLLRSASNQGDSLFVPVRTAVAGAYLVSYTAYDTDPGEGLDVFVDGVLQGNAATVQGAAGVAVRGQAVTVTLPAGVSVIRLRPSVAPSEIWIKDLIVEPV